MSMFGRLFGSKAPANRDDAANAEEQVPPEVGAVTALVASDTWEEARTLIQSRWDALQAPTANNIFDAMTHALKDDAYALAVIRQRRELLDRLRSVGVEQGLRKEPVGFKKPTQTLKFFATVLSARSMEDVPSVVNKLMGR